MPINLLRTVQRILRFFQWGWNVADRLAFTEVLASGKPLNASMDEVYTVFGLDQATNHHPRKLSTRVLQPNYEKA